MAQPTRNNEQPNGNEVQPNRNEVEPTKTMVQTNNNEVQPKGNMTHPTGRFPTKEVFGFLTSIIMTLLAIIVAFRTNLSGGAIMTIIGGLALLQAGLQLTMFMHVTEGKDGRANVINMIYSFFLAVVIIGGSIWILTSGHMAGH